MDYVYLKTLYDCMDKQDFGTLKRQLDRQKIKVRGFSTLDKVSSALLATSLAKSRNLIPSLKTVANIYWPGLSDKWNDKSLEGPYEEDKIPGYLALFVIQGKSDSQEAAEVLKMAEDYINRKQTGTEAQDFNEEKIDESVNQNAGNDEEEQYEDDQILTDDNDEIDEGEKEYDLSSSFQLLEEEWNRLEASKVIGNDKSWRLGFINVLPSTGNRSFYNFYPIIDYKEGGDFNIIENPRAIFPLYGNINIYSDEYNGNSILNAAFRDGKFYALFFEDENIEDNSPQKTIYKININKIPQQYRIELCDLGIYMVVEPIDSDISLADQKNVRVDADGLADGENVLLLYQDKLLGPFILRYQQNMNTYTVNTHITEKKYVLKAYKTTSGSVRNCLTFVSHYDPVLKRDVDSSFVYLDPDLFVEGNVDLTNDTLLLGDFLKYMRNASPDVSISEVVDEYLKSSLTGLENISENIRLNRRNRIKNYLLNDEKIKNLADDIVPTIISVISTYYANNPNFKDNLVPLLTQNDIFMSSIQKFKIIQDKIESANQNLVETEKKLANADNEVAKILEGKNAQIKGLEKELSNLEKQKKRVMESIQEAAYVDDLNQAAVVLKARNTELQKEKESLESKLNQVTKKLTTAADNIEIAFDPFIANKMIEAAESYDNKRENEKIAEGITFLQEKSRGQKKELKGEGLVEHLYNEFCKYRKIGFSHDDIVNLMICMVQGRITVFSGAPGTGKTSTCNILAHILGLDSFDKEWKRADRDISVNRYIPVSVERGWTSKRDLIGYYNPLGKHFNASNHKLYNAFRIMDAEMRLDIGGNKKDSTYPLIVMLDEANLSPMEYYWADFMNLCDDLSGDETVSLGENVEFKVSPALRFLATINNDHTTEILSPRLIDRAWIVSLPYSNSIIPEQIDFNNVCNHISYDALMSTFGAVNINKLEDNSTASEIWNDVTSKFIIQGLSVSPRIRLAVRNYWSTAQQYFSPDGDVDPSVKALDYAIDQKLLPKITGNGEAFRSFLDEFAKYCTRNNLSKCADTLTRIIKDGDIRMGYYQFF